MTVRALLLDVNETLFPMTPVAERFEQVGLDPGQFDAWFTRILRDGFALAATGRPADFATLARHHLGALAHASGLRLDQQAGNHVVSGFLEVAPHPDVPAGLAEAAAAGLRVATLTNGSEEITRSFLQRAGLQAHVDLLLEAATTGAWKPHPKAYDWALSRLSLPAREVMMVAVHPWDVHGAVAAGLQGAWLDRNDAPWPDHFDAPTLRAANLSDVVAGATNS